MVTEKVDLASANIHYKTLIDLHNNYLNEKHKLLPGNTPEGDTKSIWFELNDSMRKFLHEVLEDTNVDGIRAYIIQYPSQQREMDGELIPKKVEDISQLSIGFVTTTSKDGRRVDYYESKNEEKVLVLAPPMNHGELCPRLCPDPTPF